MSEEFDRRSYREADLGESYEATPRVISSHSRTTYSRLKQFADNLNFNSPIFDGMMKRNGSVGSAQAFIVELALSDKRFVEENLLPFCIGKGINIMLGSHYMDNVYFDRLEAYTAKRKRKFVPIEEERPIAKQKRSYFLGGSQ